MRKWVGTLMLKGVLSTKCENLEVSLRRNVITQLLSRCLQVGPKQSIHKMGPQSFSTEQHVFCPTESSSGLIRILYSCSVKDYSFFFFKYNSRESVFFFLKTYLVIIFLFP